MHNISIHAAHTGSDLLPCGTSLLHLISIHAAHTGSDEDEIRAQMQHYIFQSTLPIRAATRGDIDKSFYADISIHAAHTGSDIKAQNFKRMCVNFNPRCPYGQRLIDLTAETKQAVFQSTLPIRAATGTLAFGTI